MSESRSKSFIVGAMLGMAVGSITGFLMAPQKGEETRKELKKKFNQYSKKINKSLQEISDKGGTLPEEALKMGKSLLNVAENQFGNVMKAVEHKEEKAELQNVKESEHVVVENKVVESSEEEQTPRKKRFFKGI